MPGALRRRDGPGLQPDLQKQGFLIPGAGRQLHGHAKGTVPRRAGIIVPEIIEHFLDAHRIGGHAFSPQDHGAQLGVGGGVHVRGEGGQRVHIGKLKAVFPNEGIFIGIPAVRRLPAGQRRRAGGGIQRPRLIDCVWHGEGIAILRFPGRDAGHIPIGGAVRIGFGRKQHIPGFLVHHAGGQQIIAPLEGQNSAFRVGIKDPLLLNFQISQLLQARLDRRHFRAGIPRLPDFFPGQGRQRSLEQHAQQQRPGQQFFAFHS